MNEEQEILVCGYKLKGGEVEANTFKTKDGKLPKGWVDSPEKLQKKSSSK